MVQLSSSLMQNLNKDVIMAAVGPDITQVQTKRVICTALFINSNRIDNILLEVSSRCTGIDPNILDILFIYLVQDMECLSVLQQQFRRYKLGIGNPNYYLNGKPEIAS